MTQELFFFGTDECTYKHVKQSKNKNPKSTETENPPNGGDQEIQ